MALRRIIALAVALMATPVLAQTNQGSSPLSIPKGGTNASSAAAARTNLAVPYLNGSNLFTGGAQTVSLNATAPPAADTGTLLHVVGADASIARIESTTFGAQSFVSVRRADGTNASPAALTTDDQIGAFNFHGYYASAFSGPQASISGYAGGAWTSSSLPAYLDLKTTASGSTVLTTRMRVEKSGGITVPNTVAGGDQGVGTINAAGLFIGGVGVPSSARTINTTAPLLGGGNLSVDRTLSIQTNGISYSLVQQVAALSLLGNCTGATANVAESAGTANQIMRVNGAGTSCGFGTIDLSQSAAVGTSVLGVVNGGTGSPTASGARTNLGVAIGSNVQAWDSDLDALAANSAAGLWASTGTGTGAARQIVAPVAGLTITNPAGTAGNPTLALANDLAALEALASTGFAARTGTDAWAQRTLQPPAAGLTITNPAGVAGDPTFVLANDLAAVEGLSGTGLARRTGTDAWSVGTPVANAELATMLNNTIKGNVAGSTTTPSDLTSTQVTAMLNAMVGDSGSGGTKGLVPAPAAGDYAAGKFLNAGGGYSVPAGGGGGGGLADADRQNALLDSIYQAKLYGGYRRMINRFADGYKASDGINAGSSTNYSVNTGAGNVSPTSSAGSLISAGAGTAIGDMTGAGGLAASFDGTTSASFASSGTSYKSASTSGYNNTIGKNWGTGVTHTVARFVVYASSDYGVLGAGGGGTVKLQGSNNGTTWVDLYTTPSAVLASGGTSLDVSTGIDVSTAYQYHRININGNGSNSTATAEVQFYDPGSTNNMTLVTTTQTTDATVSYVRVLLEYDNTFAPTLNTDLTVEVTCNGGTNWASASLSAVTSYSQANRKVAESVDQSCGANTGTSVAARIKTLNNKNVPLYGTSLTVH
jgi:hypothetical protein